MVHFARLKDTEWDSLVVLRMGGTRFICRQDGVCQTVQIIPFGSGDAEIAIFRIDL